MSPPLLALCLAAAACHSPDVSQVEPREAKEERTHFAVEVNRDVDILFVIDDSNSMDAEQVELTEHFHAMIEALETLEGGLPNVHIGVVSTDLGAGDYGTVNGCTELGKRGVLQATPRIEGCQGPGDPYIRDVELDGGGRDRNYPGELADAFACVAKLGTGGCGFEQPLEAMRLALDGNPANQGFLRDDALLAVIFLADEDDCSTADPRMFDPADPRFGPRGSFRCFEHGVVCEGDENPREPGERTGCAPREDSPYMHDVAGYVEFLRGLERFPDSRIVVAGMIAETSPVRVVLEQGNQGSVPALERTCELGPDDTYGADPPIRLQAFIDSFALHHTERICNEDLSPAVRAIGEIIKDSLNDACVRNPLRDIDPVAPGLQAECVVEEIRLPRTALEQRAQLARCDAPADPERSSVLPCYLIEEAGADECELTPQHLKVAVYYAASDARDPSTEIDARCVGE